MINNFTLHKGQQIFHLILFGIQSKGLLIWALFVTLNESMNFIRRLNIENLFFQATVFKFGDCGV